MKYFLNDMGEMPHYNYYKFEEIQNHALDYISDNEIRLEDFTEDPHELHNMIYNEDYYIIGTYKAKEWLGKLAFEIMVDVKNYELNHFGESYTDLTSPENVVNMYVYIVGEVVINRLFEDTFYEPIDWNIRKFKMRGLQRRK
ncbi:MAG TPA: hypothetical protein DHV22_00545 [Xanthomarina gelatinilytica]|uniref:Uncharacterized protein n=1 Tax=Xanthomarina gelatinilytica TaxID=1137281 RepID=A0A3D6BLM2_9FLAO|nr:hypothetical protein [Xanthomarina gelatinilytica]